MCYSGVNISCVRLGPLKGLASGLLRRTSSQNVAENKSPGHPSKNNQE